METPIQSVYDYQYKEPATLYQSKGGLKCLPLWRKLGEWQKIKDDEKQIRIKPEILPHPSLTEGFITIYTKKELLIAEYILVLQ